MTDSTDIGADATGDQPKRKVSVSLQPGESTDDFAARAMRMLTAASEGHVIERVLRSAPEEWATLPSDRWLEAELKAMPDLHVRLTSLATGDGGSVAHLDIESRGELVHDDWGDEHESIYLPKSDDGHISTGRAILWSLVHEIRGVGDLYDYIFERSGLIIR
jgi:hypothetical protein